MRLLNVSAIVCAVLCLILMGVRIVGAISFSEPLHVVTSGWEQESLVAFWEYLHDRPIYVSRWEIPYRWAIYNWLYYISYASIIDTVSTLLSLDVMWWPTVGRLLTLTIMVATIIGAYLSYSAVLGPLDRREKPLGAAFAVFVGAGPVVGFWALTSRPDLMALTMEIWAVFLFWRWYGRRPLVAVLLFCIAAYAAWAFKQSYANAVGAVGLFLLFHRQWKLLAVLCVVMIGSWSLTLLVGTEDYVNSMVQTEFNWIASADHALEIFWLFAKKAIPVLAGGGILVFFCIVSRPLRERCWKSDPFVFALCGSFVSLLLASATIPQPGSADHYLFSFIYFLSLTIMVGFRLVSSEDAIYSRMVWANAAGWMLQSIAILTVLFGLSGVTSVRFEHDFHVKAKECLDPLPRPLFIPNHYLSLPWMSPGNPSFVLAYGYHFGTKMGWASKRERGGIGGLIQEKYFAALVFPSNFDGLQFDGVSLDGYERVDDTCAEHDVFMPKKSSP